jgi:hypothetical protein
MKNTKLLGAALALAALAALPRNAAAQGYADPVKKARYFLEHPDRAKMILFFAHPEAQYKGIRLKRTEQLEDSPGHFTLSYIFEWKSPLSGDDNTTKLVFKFDKGGRFYDVLPTKSEDTTSDFSPFSAFDLLLKLGGNEIRRKVEQDGSETEKELVRQLIKRADGRRLLILVLRIDQRLVDSRRE